jgi:ELWxxDGT repeat protein
VYIDGTLAGTQDAVFNTSEILQEFHDWQGQTVVRTWRGLYLVDNHQLGSEFFYRSGRAFTGSFVYQNTILTYDNNSSGEALVYLLHPNGEVERRELTGSNLGDPIAYFSPDQRRVLTRFGTNVQILTSFDLITGASERFTLNGTSYRYFDSLVDGDRVLLLLHHPDLGIVVAETYGYTETLKILTVSDEGTIFNGSKRQIWRMGDRIFWTSYNQIRSASLDFQDQEVLLEARPFGDSLYVGENAFYFYLDSQIWQSDGTSAGTLPITPKTVFFDSSEQILSVSEEVVITSTPSTINLISGEEERTFDQKPIPTALDSRRDFLFESEDYLVFTVPDGSLGVLHKHTNDYQNVEPDEYPGAFFRIGNSFGFRSVRFGTARLAFYTRPGEQDPFETAYIRIEDRWSNVGNQLLVMSDLPTLLRLYNFADGTLSFETVPTLSPTNVAAYTAETNQVYFYVENISEYQVYTFDAVNDLETLVLTIPRHVQSVEQIEWMGVYGDHLFIVDSDNYHLVAFDLTQGTLLDRVPLPETLRFTVPKAFETVAMQSQSDLLHIRDNEGYFFTFDRSQGSFSEPAGKNWPAIEDWAPLQNHFYAIHDGNLVQLTPAGDIQTLLQKHDGFEAMGAVANFQGQLYFSAWTPTTGHEWWVSDGTADGSRLLTDLETGKASAEPKLIQVTDDYLFFEAEVGSNQLWAYDGFCMIQMPLSNAGENAYFYNGFRDLPSGYEIKATSPLGETRFIVVPHAVPQMAEPIIQDQLLQHADLNGDGILSQAEAEQVEVLDITGLAIANLNGLSRFPNLRELHARHNHIRDLAAILAHPLLGREPGTLIDVRDNELGQHCHQIEQLKSLAAENQAQFLWSPQKPILIPISPHRWPQYDIRDLVQGAVITNGGNPCAH